MTTILLLTLSNIFMTFAWYGHLKYRHAPLFKVIVISWLIAFAEYCFQVPANRIGSYEFTTAQLKTIQEVITLTVFSIFSVLYLREPLKWNYLVGFAMMIGAVAVIFKKCGWSGVAPVLYCGGRAGRPALHRQHLVFAGCLLRAGFHDGRGRNLGNVQ
jgi:uncharacterized protein (DUF486 family)